MKIGINKTGLALGILSGLMHFAWITYVWAFKDNALNFISNIHFLNITGSSISLTFGTAIMGIILAFVSGYITGVIFAWIWNKLN